jgi:Domain of unknown function (DUF4397)
MIMKTAKILSIVSLFTSSLLFITSCTPDPEPVVAKEYGKIMLFHGAVGAAAVDLYVDGAKTNATSLAYGSNSPYAQIEAGTISHKILTKTVTGATIDSTSLKANKDVGYSYYAYKDIDAASTVRVLATTDALTLPAAGKGKIRLVHLIADIPLNGGVDVEAVAPAGLATSRNDFTNVKFKESRDFVEVAKGTYDLKIKLTGTTNLLLTVPNVVVTEGKITTLVAHGLSAKINTDPQAAKVTVIANN